MRPGKSQWALGLTAFAVILCLLSAALPAYLSGDLRSGAVAFALLSGAAGAAYGAWSLHCGALHAAAAADPEGRSLLEGVAGVLRDGLTTIQGFSGLLAPEEGPPRDGPDLRNACRFILDSSEELARFVAALQDFLRYEQGRMRLSEQLVDAGELVQAALGPCRRTAERADVVILATLPEGLEWRCDPARLRGAIAELVLWAAGAAPAGSVVRVTLLRLPGGESELAVTSLAHPPAIADGTARSSRAWRPAGSAGLPCPLQGAWRCFILAT